MPQTKSRRIQASEERPAFDAEIFLESAGAARRVVSYPKGKTVFGQPSDAVMYIQKGSTEISVLSRTGKEAVVAMLGPSDLSAKVALTGLIGSDRNCHRGDADDRIIFEKAAMLQLLRDGLNGQGDQASQAEADRAVGFTHRPGGCSKDPRS